MPIKFFQRLALEKGKLKDIDKIKAGDEVLSISFKQGFAEQKEAIVLKEKSIFPKQSWNGFKVSWEGGSFFCTENQVILLSNHDILPVRRLEPGKHELLDKTFNPISITSVESGKVLCGKKWLYLKGDDGDKSKSLHFLNVNGIWVGDSFIEDQLESNQNKVQDNKADICPGNPVVRSIRLLMMKMMGKKEED